jgi:mRNA interferase MazF
VTRDVAIPALADVTVALITSTIRDIPSEVRLGPEDGLDHECVVNCDQLQTIPKASIGRPRGHLGPEKLSRLRAALTVALGLDSPI